MTMPTFHDTLRHARQRQGLSLRSAAERLECNSSYLHQIEHGQARPSRSLLLKILDAYHIPQSDHEELLFVGRGDDEELARILTQYPRVSYAFMKEW